MPRYAIVEDGEITNFALAEPDYAERKGWIAVPDTVNIGYVLQGKAWVAPPEEDLPEEDLPEEDLPEEATYG